MATSDDFPSLILEAEAKDSDFMIESCAPSPELHEVRIWIDGKRAVMSLDLLKEFIGETEKNVQFISASSPSP